MRGLGAKTCARNSKICILMRPMKSERYLRYQSIFVDYIVLAVLVLVTSELTTIVMEFAGEDVESAEREGSVYFVWWNAIVVTLLLNKDMLYGRSLGKIVSGSYIHCKSTDHSSGPIRCLIRNSFLLLLPIEIFALLISPSRRLGDVIVGTEIRKFTNDVETPPLNIGSITVALIATTLISFGVLEIVILIWGDWLY